MSQVTTSCQSIDAERIRREFPIFDRPLPNGRPLVYLDSAASAQKPRRVIEKETECYERYYANAYRGDYQFGVHVDEELEATRAKVRDFIGAAEPEEILFTSGTTMSINLVAQAWGRKFLAKGDEILLTQMEHHANLVPWQQVAREKGAELRFVRLGPDGLLDLDHFDELLNDRTRIVAITGMSNVLGTAPPLAEIGKRAKRTARWCLSTAPECAAPGDPRPRDADRLPGLLGAQAVWPDRDWRPLRPPDTFRGDGSVPLRRAHDRRGFLGPFDLGRAAGEIRGGNDSDRSGHRLGDRRRFCE